MQADGIPQFIMMMEDAQKKAKWARMPITNVKLVMMAKVAVLAAQHFPHEVDDWEGLLAINHMWRAWEGGLSVWPTSSTSANCMHRGGGPLGGAHSVLPAAATTIDRLGAANNQALVASYNTTFLQ
jgi:hypothetical protein